jgi:hypothetical protein
MEKLNQVTSFSKIIAAVLFIMLPVLGFWMGYQYGFDLRGLIDSSNKDIDSIMPTLTPAVTQTTDVVYDPTKCEFFIKDGGYGVDTITETDKLDICNGYKAGDGAKLPIGINIYGKEGKYFTIGVDMGELIKIDSHKFTSIYSGYLSEVDCTQVDGLGVTHIMPVCMGDTLEETIRMTK